MESSGWRWFVEKVLKLRQDKTEWSAAVSGWLDLEAKRLPKFKSLL